MLEFADLLNASTVTVSWAGGPDAFTLTSGLPAAVRLPSAL
jgi:hypothetical protein